MFHQRENDECFAPRPRTERRMWIASVCFCLLGASTPPAQGDELVSFSKHIAPILQAKCVGCHGPKTAESGYRLDSFAGVLRAANDEEPIIPNKPEASLLFQRLVTDDADLRMPAEADPLSKDQIAAFRHWIKQGAKFDGDSPDSPLADLSPAITHTTPPERYPAALPLSAVAYDPQGSQILVGGYHEITSWSSTGELLRRIQNQGERTYSMDFHPTEPWLLSASGTPGELGEVRLFDWKTGKLKSVIARADEVIMDARFSPDGSRVAVAMPDGAARIILTNTLATQTNLLGHSNQVTAVAWHSDGVRLATASRDHSAKVYDCDQGYSLATFTGHTGPVNDVTFLTPDRAISVSDDGTAQIWTVRDGKRQNTVAQDKDPIFSVVASNEKYAVAGVSGTKLFALQSNQLTKQFDDGGNCLAIHGLEAAQPMIVAGSQSGAVAILREDKPRRFMAQPGHRE